MTLVVRERGVHSAVLEGALLATRRVKVDLIYNDMDEVRDIITSFNLIFVRRDEHVETTEILAAVRYIARVERLYPTTPEKALTVDTLLDCLMSYCHDATTLVPCVIASYTSMLATRFLPFYDTYLGGFEQPTIADLCWATALMYSSSRCDVNLYECAPNTYFAVWWYRIQWYMTTCL